MSKAVALRAWILPVFGLVVVLSGCGSSGSPRGQFKNPLTDTAFADPFVFHVGKTYFGYATTSMSENFPIIYSKDLVHWKYGNDAVPQLPGWAGENPWAPEVMPRSDGKYVIYFTARDNSSGRQCLGRGIGSSPYGPFVDKESRPFLCQVDLGGDIDPSPFRDSTGKYFLLWKNDGNCCGRDTYLWSQRMTSDGMKLLGKPVQLIHETRNWEYDVVEAPTLWKHNGKYYLFFSGNDYGTQNYAVGYATCSGPLGPCTQASENPILKTRCSASGPGGQTIVTDAAGQDWMLYAAWPTSAVGPAVEGPGRELWMDKLNWTNDRPVVEGPTCTKQDDPTP